MTKESPQIESGFSVKCSPELIKQAIKCSGIPVIKHKNGNVYRVKDIVKMKINGEWVEGCTYYCISPFGQYCRELDNFKNFKYLFNDVAV